MLRQSCGGTGTMVDYHSVEDHSAGQPAPWWFDVLFL